MKKTYIHLLKGWPGLRWDAAALAEPLAAVRFEQGRLLGRMATLGFPLDGEAELTVLTEELVRSSAIEGERLDDRQVRSSLARRLGLDTGSIVPSTDRIDGLAELMLDATRNFMKPLTTERLFGWHAALFPTGRNAFGRITVGAWRKPGTAPMRVVSGPMGRETVHFEAPDARRVPQEMRAFLTWFDASPVTDPILHAGLAHFRFVTIHPFDDGNGRLARAVAEMALARSDGSPQRFYSMSAQIDNERRDYYDMLEKSQCGGLDVTPWLLWFVGCLSRALVRAETTLATVLHKARLMDTLNALPANPRQRKAVNRLLDGFEGPLTAAKYAKMNACSTDTALRDINALITCGVLVRGPSGGRSTAYCLATEAGDTLGHGFHGCC